MKSVVFVLALMLPSVVLAQTQVITQPLSTAAVNVSGTIALTGEFQQVFANNAKRKGCTIQNTSQNSMWVTIGMSAANSSISTAMILPVGSIYHCNDSGITILGDVNITGTTDDTFYATQY